MRPLAGKLWRPPGHHPLARSQLGLGLLALALALTQRLAIRDTDRALLPLGALGATNLFQDLAEMLPTRRPCVDGGVRLVGLARAGLTLLSAGVVLRTRP